MGRIKRPNFLNNLRGKLSAAVGSIAHRDHLSTPCARALSILVILSDDKSVRS